MNGYEIHMGITRGPALERPAVRLSDDNGGQRSDGAISQDGQILASYCHGLFDHPAALAALLEWAGAKATTHVDFAARREQDIERLADAVEIAIDWKKLKLAGLPEMTQHGEVNTSANLGRVSTTDEYCDAPRTFRQQRFVIERRRMLHEPHIAPLTAYVESLRSKHSFDWEFQDFDPMDGGVNADILFLLEKPGPMTSPKTKRKGSGFISRNNDDPTAEALFVFMQQAGIDRKRVVLWNVIPGWNGTIKIKAGERRDGVNELAALMKLLPRLKTVVLVGGEAGKAARLMQTMNVKIFTSAHPSTRVKNKYRAMWELIPKQWAEAGRSQTENSLATHVPAEL
jgi:hypothetical protein